MKTKPTLLLCCACLFLSTSLSSCNEDDPETPPLTYSCSIEYVDENGESLLKDVFPQGGTTPIQPEESELSVKLSMDNTDRMSIAPVYLPAFDQIKISVGDHNEIFGKDVNAQRFYTMDIKMPGVIGQGVTDRLEVLFQIRRHSFEPIRLKYNDEIVENTGSGNNDLKFTVTVKASEQE